MRCLIVSAHPLRESLIGHFTEVARRALERAGHDVDTIDLYAEGFEPCLTAQERRAYYADAAAFDERIAPHIEKLCRAEMLVLVFPTWWFGLPAILKGWIDRVFAPGVAFAHTPDFGPIRPLLVGLRSVCVVTTLGSPWWVDRLVMWRPVRRVLKTGVFRACAPQARFRYLAFYSAEQPSHMKLAAFERRLSSALG